MHISGLERVGRGYADDAVVRRVDGSGPVHVVVEMKHSLTIDLARALSDLAILVILILAVLLVRGARARAAAGRTRSHMDLPALEPDPAQPEP